MKNVMRTVLVLCCFKELNAKINAIIDRIIPARGSKMPINPSTAKTIAAIPYMLTIESKILVVYLMILITYNYLLVWVVCMIDLSLWYFFPISIVISSVAMLSGIGGAENDFTQRNTAFMSWNLMHMARMLKNGIPAQGNQRETNDYSNPEYR